MVSGDADGNRKWSIGPIIRDVWLADAIVLEKKKIRPIQSSSGA